MNLINTDISRRERKWFYAAFAFSLVAHLSLTHFLGEHFFHSQVSLDVRDRKPDISKEIVQYRFVETQEQERVRKVVKKVREISDKDSEADSSRKGDIKDDAPKGLKKRDFQQLSKRQPSSSRQKPFPTPEKIRKFDFEKKVDPVEESDSLKMLKKTDIRFVKDSPAAKRAESLYVHMPVISFGEGTFTKYRDDSFFAAQTEAGKYFSVVRKRIEEEWYKYMIFNYKSNNVLGSEALIHFRIGKDGRIVDIEKKYITGDYLFKDFCETAVLNSGPFPGIPEKMDIILKKGSLDISIYFGYDVSAARRKEKEDERKNQ